MHGVSLSLAEMLLKPLCAACGGYAQVFAVAICKKHADELDNQVYCKYCLLRLTEISIEDLHAEYDANNPNKTKTKSGR